MREPLWESIQSSSTYIWWQVFWGATPEHSSRVNAARDVTTQMASHSTEVGARTVGVLLNVVRKLDSFSACEVGDVAVVLGNKGGRALGLKL